VAETSFFFWKREIGIAVTETSFPKRVKLTLGDTSFSNLYKQLPLGMNIFSAKNNVQFSKISKINDR
jgi:hypothetical protein